MFDPTEPPRIDDLDPLYNPVTADETPGQDDDLPYPAVDVDPLYNPVTVDE